MFKKFASYYKNHLCLFLIDMFSAFSIAVIDLIVPIIFRIFMDDAIPNKDMNKVVTFSIMLVICLIFAVIFNYIVSYYGHVMGTKIEKDMRQDLFNHFQGMDMKFFSEEQVGKLMSRLVGDLRDISEFAHHGPEDIFISMIMLVGSFIILATINIPLTLILLVILIVMLIFTRIRKNRMTVAFRNTREVHANLNNQISNILSGIGVVKSYTNEEFEKNRFSEFNGEYQESWDGAYYEMGVFSSVMNLMLKLMMYVVIIVGGVLTIKGKMSAGDLAAFVLYIAYFTSPIRRLISFFDQYQKGWSGFTRFYDMLQVKDEIKDGSKKFKNLEDKIEFKNATFAYEKEKVFDNLNIEVAKNTSVALVGKTGVGKSTIAKLVPRFYDLTSGEILIDGNNIKEFTLKSLRENIGYVEQDSYIFFGTILENILYGNPDASFEEVVNAAKLASLDEFVGTLPEKYNTNVGEKGIKLSGGQRQRVSLARMFLKNPDILVLDEATSALDNQTEAMIQKSIEYLSENRTSIIIAHRLTTVEHCDTIYLLGEDQIIEKGSHSELMDKKGAYYELYMSALKKGELMI
ncbi:MAG: ABC transporter ATP-binding protein [Bacilli bacterium]